MVVVTSLCVPVVAVPVVMTPSLFVAKDAPGGHAVKIGSAPVSVEEELVDTGIGELVAVELRGVSWPTGPIVNVNPSEVIVVGPVT